MAVTYRLRRDPPPAVARLTLDSDQERVAAHPGGPLLVLAGPGTGKTATLVEAVARRVERGAAPESLLLLTFSRRAAAQMRQRIALRLGRQAAPTAWTFHSFCLALVTANRARLALPAPRLLTGPDQEVVIRELLRGDLADGRPWPDPLAGVLDTRGLSEEIRALLARAQSLGLSPDALFDVSSTRSDWQAVARFYEQYQQSLEAQGVLDYTELVARAAHVADEPETRAKLRARYSAVWVDEYQDTDGLQERLLQSIAGDGRDLVVVGDPDQAIYAFRGADVDGIVKFRQRFRALDGEAAPAAELVTCRRSGAALVTASRRVATRIPVPPGFAHRELVAAGPPGAVDVRCFPTEGAEAEWIADQLRRAHLDDGVGWSHMAVLVRSAASITALRRVLGTMGVPVEVAADELPLAAEPAIAPLLLALRCADDAAELTDDRVRELLLSPLVGGDTADLRRLGRALRLQARATSRGLPPASARLITDAVTTPGMLADLPWRETAAARRLVQLLAGARKALAAGGTPADALWSLWEASRWRDRLVSLVGGRSRDSRAAERDLDAVVALFDAVHRAQEQRVGIRVRAVLDTLAAQHIPAGPQEERAVPREGVRLLTAHRSKGLEWDVVVVAHVQEAAWPDLRPRGSLLNPHELGVDGPQGPPDVRALLADERRLFYVACTRARRRLVVTAVESVAEDGERPSRFLDELAVPVTRQTVRPVRPRTLAGLVAALRCEAVDPSLSDQVRAAAAHRLARLAEARDAAGNPLVPAADPARWWGMLPRSEGEPYDAGRPMPISASTLTKLDECPLAWFLAHEARGDSPATVALGFGKVVHALADLVAKGALPVDEQALVRELDRVWPSLGYDVPWQQANERENARGALHRLVGQLAARRGRELVDSEVAFEHTVATDTGPVVLRGRMDRIERDEAGRYVVVDLKTNKTKPSAKDVPTDRQLALYQYVVDSGGVSGVPAGAQSGGAELWQLRDAGPELPTVQRQEPPEEGHDALLANLAEARRRILAEEFVATRGTGCDRCSFRGSCPAQDDGRTVLP